MRDPGPCLYLDLCPDPDQCMVPDLCQDPDVCPDPDLHGTITHAYSSRPALHIQPSPAIPAQPLPHLCAQVLDHVVCVRVLALHNRQGAQCGALVLDVRVLGVDRQHEDGHLQQQQQQVPVSEWL